MLGELLSSNLRAIPTRTNQTNQPLTDQELGVTLIVKKNKFKKEKKKDRKSFGWQFCAEKNCKHILFIVIYDVISLYTVVFQFECFQLMVKLWLVSVLAKV